MKISPGQITQERLKEFAEKKMRVQEHVFFAILRDLWSLSIVFVVFLMHLWWFRRRIQSVPATSLTRKSADFFQKRFPPSRIVMGALALFSALHAILAGWNFLGYIWPQVLRHEKFAKFQTNKSYLESKKPFEPLSSPPGPPPEPREKMELEKYKQLEQLPEAELTKRREHECAEEKATIRKKIITSSVRVSWGILVALIVLSLFFLFGKIHKFGEKR